MELFYREKGTGPQSLIIIHGLYGASDNWMSFAGSFEEDFRVIMIDQRNHGKSPHSEEHTYEAMVSDLWELMQNLKIEKAVLLGHSMGGKTAMRFCLEHPEKVEKLIVADIAPKSYAAFSNYAEATADHQKIIETLSALEPSKFEDRNEIDKALKTSFPSKQLRAFMMKNLERTKEGHYQWKINLQALKNNIGEIMNGFSDLSVNPQQQLPESIFIKGEKSPYIHEDDHLVINKFFPGAQIVTIPDSGHWIHAEQPELFIKTVKYFLDT
ncbi:MAG: alpha/beta fold hydrolase [Marinilabiliaceae bacterium]